MARIPPWRWSLFGPWPTEQGPPLSIPDEKIRPLAGRLSKQRPWLSADENWLAAERALRRRPWRLWMIRFSGDKERSGWDWADLLLKVSVPVLILIISTAYSYISADRNAKTAKADKERQEIIASEQQESQAVASFIKEMQPLLIEKRLRSSAPGSEVRGVARGLTLASLSQVKNSGRKRLIIRFLLDSGLNANSGNLINLSEADLSRADLSGVDLSGVDLRGADLRGADLRGAYLSGADLRGAYLRLANLDNANLDNANLYEADLSGATLYWASLIEADLNANFTRANLTNANLSRAQLGLANFLAADLSWTKLNESNLSRAELFSANLHGADLSGADLRGARLYEANLESINWDEKTRWPEPVGFGVGKNIPEDLKKKLGL